MEKKEYVFSCTGDFEDFNYLYQLFINNGIDSKLKGVPMQNHQMGLEEIIIVLISNSIIPSVLNIINIWLQNRGKEIKIIDNNTGKELYLKSNNGKCLSDSDIQKIQSFFNA